MSDFRNVLIEGAIGKVQCVVASHIVWFYTPLLMMLDMALWMQVACLASSLTPDLKTQSVEALALSVGFGQRCFKTSEIDPPPLLKFTRYRDR